MEVQVLENVKHLEHWILLCYVKQKSAIDPITGDVNYELIINSLPQNFNELPYSQRKKLVKSFLNPLIILNFRYLPKTTLVRPLDPELQEEVFQFLEVVVATVMAVGLPTVVFQEGIEQEVSIP